MQPELLYFADPMCSWCWGFSPVIAQIANELSETLPIRVFVGGLAIGVDHPLSETAKREIATHWQHVHDLTRQAFDQSFFDREEFVYNSELPSQAVVAIRNANQDSLQFLSQLHRAFYAENQDITDESVLTDIAVSCGFEPQSFCDQLRAEATLEDAQKDYELTQKLGIQGFPALLGMADGRIELLTMGYQDYANLMPKIEKWLQQAKDPQPLG